MKVAVVGGGCSGVICALNIIESRKDMQVTLFDAGSEPGRGIAYENVCDKWLLNVPASGMGIYAEDAGHFLRWINENSGKTDAYAFVRRSLYGSYLQETLFNAARKNPDRLLIESQKISDIITAADGLYNLTFENGGEAGGFGAVVLATGNQAPGTAAVLHKSGMRIISNPWEFSKLRGVSGLKRILIVGSGLTAVDFALKLCGESAETECLLLSRHGMLPLRHAATPVETIDLSAFVRSWNGLNDFFKRSRRLVDEKCGGEWRIFADSLRPHLNTVWKSMNGKDRGRFLRHLRSYWEVLRHRFAPEIGDQISFLAESGRVKQIAGRLRSLEPELMDHRAVVALRGGGEETYNVQAVINCTGGGAYRWEDNALFANLLKRGLAVPGDFDWGIRTAGNNRVAGKSGDVVSGLYALGPVCRGTLWETTAVREIREQAAVIAAQI